MLRRADEAAVPLVVSAPVYTEVVDDGIVNSSGNPTPSAAPGSPLQLQGLEPAPDGRGTTGALDDLEYNVGEFANPDGPSGLGEIIAVEKEKPEPGAVQEHDVLEADAVKQRAMMAMLGL